MTKLQLLHRALNERLMAVVEQIMEMVGGTVLEYEEETVRARKENEALRRRLRWLEGEIPTDWPDNEANSSGFEQPVIVNDTSGFEKPVIMDDKSGIEQPVIENSSINIEPINVSDLQSLIPDASANLKIVNPRTTKATNFGISNSTVWNLSDSYMAPLDCDPTVSGQSRGKGRISSRTKRMSFACPDCGKVFGREQTLVFHMRIHTADRPYACRSRKACFYGDKKRKNKVDDLHKVHASNKFVEDDSNTGESTGPATVSDPVKNQKEKKKNKRDKTNKKSQEHPKKPVVRTNETEAEQARAGGHHLFQCSECKKTFPHAALLAVHLKSHIWELMQAQKMPKKKQPEKKVSKISTQMKKNLNMVAEKGSPCASKKIFECPHCDMVFTHKGQWSLHILSHTNKTTSPQNRGIRNLSPISAKKKKKAVSQLAKEEEIGTDNSNVGIDNSKSGTELQATVVGPKQMNLEPESESKPESVSESKPESVSESKPESISESKPESVSESKPESISASQPKSNSRRKGKKSKITEDVSSEIPEESTEESIQRPRQTYSCKECGKVYIMAGSLATHIKGHEAKRMQKKKEKQEQKKLKWIIEKEAKIKKLAEAKALEKQNSINIREDTGAGEVEIRGPFGQIKYKCGHCDKTFNRRNVLYMHMFWHLEEKVKDEPQDHDVQESSPIEDCTVQNGKEPAIESCDGNGGFAVTESDVALSQDHASPTQPMESTEPQSACSNRKFSLRPRQSPSSTISSFSTNQIRTHSTFDSRITNHFRLQPRIVLQPLNVKSKTFTFPGKCDLVPAEPGAHVPVKSTQSDSPEKQRGAEASIDCVTFSDDDSEDDNDWSDVLHSLDEEITQEQTASEKLADMETADTFHPTCSQQEPISQMNKNHSVRDDPLTNRDEPVANSVQDTGKHSGLTCVICGFKFAGNASLSQHMRMHTSEPAGKSVNFKASCSRVVNSGSTKVQQLVVQEQTSEAQDASTNIPQISKWGSETQSKSRKTKQYCKERKVLHCNFCGKACRKIELHLKYDHPREPEVIEALKRGQNFMERKRLLSSLCSLKVSESDEVEAALVHCLFCQGSYQRNQFWKHALVCEQRKGTGGSEAGNSVCTENGPSEAQTNGDPEYKNEVEDATSNTTLPEVDPSTVQKPVITKNSEMESSNSPVSPSCHSTPVTTSHPQLTLADPHSDDPSSDTSVVRSRCSPVQSEHTQQPQDKRTDTSHASEDMGMNSEGTGSELGLTLQDSDCSTVLKRKLDNQDSKFTEAKTKKKRQSDPPQPTTVDNNLTDETDESQTPHTDKEASGCSFGNG